MGRGWVFVPVTCKPSAAQDMSCRPTSRIVLTLVSSTRWGGRLAWGLFSVLASAACRAYAPNLSDCLRTHCSRLDHIVFQPSQTGFALNPTNIVRRGADVGRNPTEFRVPQSALASRANIMYNSQRCARSQPRERPKRPDHIFQEQVTGQQGVIPPWFPVACSPTVARNALRATSFVCLALSCVSICRPAPR